MARSDKRTAVRVFEESGATIKASYEDGNWIVRIYKSPLSKERTQEFAELEVSLLEDQEAALRARGFGPAHGNPEDYIFSESVTALGYTIEKQPQAKKLSKQSRDTY